MPDRRAPSPPTRRHHGEISATKSCAGSRQERDSLRNLIIRILVERRGLPARRRADRDFPVCGVETRVPRAIVIAFLGDETRSDLTGDPGTGR